MEQRAPLLESIARYEARHVEALARDRATEPQSELSPVQVAAVAIKSLTAEFAWREFGDDYITLAVIPPGIVQQSQPASDRAPFSGDAPAGYWKDDLWKQMGSEFKHFALRDFWLGYKKAFWKWENALLIGGTWGASIVIRESDVDRAIDDRIRGHRQLGDMDEPLQILGNPATHFAFAGVMWLGTAMAKDEPNHEFAKALTQALCVNGLTTMVLKVSANTRTPDGESLGWPSGHTSSAFTIASVANEYYGPWVGIPSLALAGMVGYQRLDSRVHDFSDVVFGAVLGYVVGSSIAKENKQEATEIFGMRLVPYTDPKTGAAGLALLKQY